MKKHTATNLFSPFFPTTHTSTQTIKTHLLFFLTQFICIYCLHNYHAYHYTMWSHTRHNKPPLSQPVILGHSKMDISSITQNSCHWHEPSYLSTFIHTTITFPVMRSGLPLMLRTTLPVFPHCHPTVLPHTSDQNASATNTRIHTHSHTHHFHIQANTIFAHRLLCYYDTLSFADNAKTAGS